MSFLVLGTIVAIFVAAGAWRRHALAGLDPTCPGCKGPKLYVPLTGWVRCDRCREFVRKVKGQKRLEVIPPGATSVMSPYLLEFAELVSPGEWRFPWGGRCAMCPGPAETTRKIAVSVMTGATPLLFGSALVRTSTWTFEIGSCAKHEKWNPIEQEINSPRLQFTSIDRCREFLAANRKPREAPPEESDETENP